MHSGLSESDLLKQYKMIHHISLGNLDSLQSGKSRVHAVGNVKCIQRNHIFNCVNLSLNSYAKYESFYLYTNILFHETT